MFLAWRQQQQLKVNLNSFPIVKCRITFGATKPLVGGGGHSGTIKRAQTMETLRRKCDERGTINGSGSSGNNGLKGCDKRQDVLTLPQLSIGFTQTNTGQD
ncbi:hypothetical protein Q8A73_019428 [Channa argus]|nr:hypothetical protein Q8A73_019428 [Channa argus]